MLIVVNNLDFQKQQHSLDNSYTDASETTQNMSDPSVFTVDVYTAKTKLIYLAKYLATTIM